MNTQVLMENAPIIALGTSLVVAPVWFFLNKKNISNPHVKFKTTEYKKRFAQHKKNSAVK